MRHYLRIHRKVLVIDDSKIKIQRINDILKTVYLKTLNGYISTNEIVIFGILLDK